jgi:long-chain-fatty-acid--[acyl-carrier-protein] ligase
LLSVLPPFHSFGLTAGVLMPLLFGIPTVHHPDPREGAMMARLVAAHRLTLAGGTPTFLAAMARAAAAPLESLRLLVLGGEACPDAVWELLARACPRARILEGYGVSECSPIVAINAPDAARRGTVGRVLPSLEHAVVAPESCRRLRVGERGELLVRGPSVFAGYLGEGAASPFVDLDGRRFYRTGDLVSEDADGFLTLHGRRRRFVKVGGEMVSLPAVEAALAERFADGDEGTVLAVVAKEGEGRPELALVTTLAVDRVQVNRAIRDAGLSALHNVQRVVRLGAIPVLGTGKTDHRAVAELVARLDA